MDVGTAIQHQPQGSQPSKSEHGSHRLSWATPPSAVVRAQTMLSNQYFLQILTLFAAYYLAGKLGQATTNIRSGNLGPVWPASGIALAGFLAGGFRIWPGIAAGSFLVAYQSPVLAITAAGQAAAATLGAAFGAFLLRRLPNFDPTLSRLRDALAFVVLGGFVSAALTASLGMAALRATRFDSYSGFASSWLIYWLGDATGILLVTPLIFTAPMLFGVRTRARRLELAVLVMLLVGVSFVVFGDFPLFSVRLHVLAFAVLPFVMWAAIGFGVGGASLSVFVIATLATLLTSVGSGPFSDNTPFVNAVLLDLLFTVLAVSGLALAAVITERERAEAEREEAIRAQMAMEARLRLAAIVESSNEAILSTSLDGTILSWNAAAQRIFGFTAAEAIGQPVAMLIPPDRWAEDHAIVQQLQAGKRIEPHETKRLTKSGQTIDVAVTISALQGANGELIGAARIARDITEQKRAEEALSNVSRRLIEAQEQERTRIARELHDDIGQRLSLLSTNLVALTQGAFVAPRFDALTSELQRQASEIASDIQALSHRLHSSRLELLGLTAAMRRFCEEFAEQQKVTIDFKSRDLPNHLPRDVSLSLFRILQEALHNGAKHSGVERFGVRLWAGGDGIHLVVRDGGRGFDVKTARTARGIGLVSMEERMKLVGGELVVESQPEHGTTIHARVPFRSPQPPTVA
jgi:PAS domain S-box-containing protein